MPTAADRSHARPGPFDALASARRVADPWFRCQALAKVAWEAEDEAAFGRIISEAADTAIDGANGYKQVAVLAWPLRAMIERGRRAQATATTAQALPVSLRIANPVSRADALFLLWQAAYPLGGEATGDLLTALLAACHEADSWKAPRLLAHIALIVATHDPAGAQAIVATLPDGRHKRQTLRRLAAGETRTPRPFSW